MISYHTSDISDLIGELFSSNKPDYDRCQSTLNLYASEGGVICNMIVILLSKQFPLLLAPCFDSVSIQKSPFERALSACLTKGIVSCEELTFFEKLIVCNAMFAFDCVCEKTVLEVCSHLHKSFSQKKQLMTLFLLSESEARNSAFPLLSYMVLDLANRCQLLGKEMGSVREVFFDGMESSYRCLESDIDVFAECIYQITRDLALVKKDPSKEKDFNKLFSHSQGGIDLCFSFDGKNSGVGSIAFERVRVVTFGPQILDLGQIDRYGIGFSAPDRSNVSCSVSEEKFSCRGWSRCYGDKDVWVEHDFRMINGDLDLIISFESFSEQPEISECFFVSCESVLVGEKLIKVGSLDRFSEVARSLILISGDEEIKLSLENDVLIEIIPLAGGPHFWGATFLIAFVPKALNNKLHLTVTKDYNK